MINETTPAEPLPQGFAWSAVRAGIKASRNLDLALAVAPKGADAAVLFTTNQVVAAPITVGRRHLSATGGKVKAILVNAGNANCASGESGIRACNDTCRAAAEALGCIFDEVFPSSTGIIGVPLPAEKIVAALPEAVSQLGNTGQHAALFASAIMTTDTRMKVASAVIGDTGACIFGTAKGAGMIHPQLGPPHATMLVYLFTDIAADSATLRDALAPAAETTFNSISIDGDTSTNDTVLLLASGASGVVLNAETSPAFVEALHSVCASLAFQIVDDGEGVTHVVTLEISGAKTSADAKKVARAIAHSPLNKCAWSSADPNWGRLLAAAGYSGIPFNPENVIIRIGDQLVFEHGTRATLFDKDAAHRAMSAREYTIRIALGEGDAACTFLTCDLTEEYVRINADYST